jgi:hypothetical protein
LRIKGVKTAVLGKLYLVALKKVGGSFELSEFKERGWWNFGFSDLEEV